jgi:hypothetical protein
MRKTAAGIARAGRVIAGVAILAAALAGVAAQAQPAPAAAAAVQRTFEADYAINLGAMGTVGEARLRINTNGPNYAATFNREATGVARWAVGNAQDYRQISRGQITPQGVRAASYERKGGKRGRVVQVAFSAQDVVTTATPALGSMGNPPATRAQRLEAMDDVSAFVAMVFDPSVSDPCARTIKIYDGRQRYDLVMRPNGETRVNTRGYRGQGRRCSVSYRPIAGFTDPVEANTGMSFVFAPLAAGVWAPVRVESVMDDGGVAVLEAKRIGLR